MILLYSFIFLYCTSDLCYLVNGDNLYENLPPVFQIDDYEKCKREGKTFCKLSIILKPVNENTSQLWKLIQHSISNKQAYNHDELYYAICVNDVCPKLTNTSETDLPKAISKCYNEKFSNLGLSTDIVSIVCNNVEDLHKPGLVDYTWLIFFVSYCLFVLMSTFWEYINRKRNYLAKFGKKYLLPFSMISNFKKFKTFKINSDFEKLKCIQGIRFYNMLLIIFCHTFSSYGGGYVVNTEYLENIPNNPIRHGVRNLMAFLVQTFFLFSAFLMSYHFFQIMENKENENNKLKIVWLTFLNRYIRLAPPLIVMVGMNSTVWVVNFLYGPIKELYAGVEYQRCYKNWWPSLLLIHNHYNQDETCIFTTWYLAADTQLYLLSLIILLILWKTKKNVKVVLISLIILGIIIPIVIFYTYNLDIMFRLTPENSKINKLFSSEFNVTYTSTYANMATYMIGLWLGYTYFRFRNINIAVTQVHVILWYTLFMGLPFLVIAISSNYYSRIMSALLGGILKPLYSTGIAVGIFGMSRGIGGIIKTVCEWKPALILGNLTYSTYIVHYATVFSKTATTTRPFYVSDYVLIKSFIIDTILSFLLGLTMYILIELPTTHLQKMWIPQIRRESVKHTVD